MAGLARIGLSDQTIFQYNTKIKLRQRMLLPGGAAVPVNGARGVGGDRMAAVIGGGEVELGLGIALLGACLHGLDQGVLIDGRRCVGRPGGAWRLGRGDQAQQREGQRRTAAGTPRAVLPPPASGRRYVQSRRRHAQCRLRRQPPASETPVARR